MPDERPFVRCFDSPLSSQVDRAGMFKSWLGFMWTHASKCCRLAARAGLGLGLAVVMTGGRAAAEEGESARGVVFDDRNGNGFRDAGEVGVAGVLVSNQREVTQTDVSGQWQLPVRDECIFFVIKPAGWMTPVNEHQLPRFYYIHKPAGSPRLRYGGVRPTGPLPESIDFPLLRRPEPGRFQAVYFADTQARDQKELDYMAHDVVEELTGSSAAFGVTLGDILFDDLSLFRNHNALIALVGIPWYNVIGNHDINYDALDDQHSDETFERYFGPSYYAFDHGPVTFVVLDDVVWGGAKPAGTGEYTGGLGVEQLTFLENLLPYVDENRLLVLMMHIPLPGVSDRETLFRLIEHRPYTMSISGHTHWQAHWFLDEEEGWRGAEPHHHVVNVTVCGSWWSGEPDETGIPHTMMADGAPNGYSIITFDGQSAVVDFKAARRPADYQMRVDAPEVVSADDSAAASVYVNVFGGSERSTVEMRVGESGEWIRLDPVQEVDPYFQRLKDKEANSVTLVGRPLPKTKVSRHLWKAPLPSGLEVGIHRIRIRSEDMYGRIMHGSRVIRVEQR